MSIQQWSHFFKPEVRKQGQKHFDDGDVFLKIKADTRIHAYVKSSSPIRIHFSATSIDSSAFNVDCTCPPSAKGQFCKHIWATLLAVEQQHPDFLDSKKEINKIHLEPEAKKAPTPDDERAQRQADQKEKIKAKQSEYRKEQYQKQKQRLKEKKYGKLAESEESNFPPKIQGAVDFFAENGFTFIDPIDPNEVANARKILSRVFHPDKGGTHEEVLILNSNYEILMKWSGG